MACETTNTSLSAPVVTTDVAAVGRCRNCGKCCCNCEKCQKEKPLNVCTACHRAAAAVSKKAGVVLPCRAKAEVN